jgi:hypothetical protein
MSQAVDIDSIEAGRELDARIMVKLFGWGWWRMKSRGLCVLWPPGGDARFVRTNCGPDSHEQFKGWPTEDERFDDWDYSVRRRHLSGSIGRDAVPAPSTDADSMMYVLSVLPFPCMWQDSHGWTCRLNELDDQSTEVFSTMYEASGDTLPLAVCRAALRWAEQKEVQRG